MVSPPASECGGGLARANSEAASACAGRASPRLSLWTPGSPRLPLVMGFCASAQPLGRLWDQPLCPAPEGPPLRRLFGCWHLELHSAAIDSVFGRFSDPFRGRLLPPPARRCVRRPCPSEGCWQNGPGRPAMRFIAARAWSRSEGRVGAVSCRRWKVKPEGGEPDRVCPSGSTGFTPVP